MAEYNFKTGVDTGEYRDFLNASPAYCFIALLRCPAFPQWLLPSLCHPFSNHLRFC